MSKKAAPTDFSFNALVELCRRTHEELRSRAIRSVDIAMVVRNWLIGWYIVEYEQTGADRAQYGSRLIERLAAKLHLKGSSATNLRKFRQFYRDYPIQQTLSVESGKAPSAPLNWQAVSVELFASKYQLYLPSKEVLKAQLEKIEAELKDENREWRIKNEK